ncbi:unnamed protein product [Auanema sp. JU1783]|nr:unnamed protein product [Auanema sp. JU1783]
MEFRTYPRRWVILLVCCLLALSNAFQWISYSTVPQQINKFYCNGMIDCLATFWSNQIFQVVAILTGIFGMYVCDVYGIKIALFCGCAVNFLGSLLRLISSSPEIPNSFLRQFWLYSGCFLSSLAQVVFLVLPAKIAECWFADNERALANVFTFIANPLGTILASLTPMLFFDFSEEATDTFSTNSLEIFNFNMFISFWAGITFFAWFCIKSSLPPSPPSMAAHIRVSSISFKDSIIFCLKDSQFHVLMFLFAMLFTLYWTFIVLLPDIMSLKGYNSAGINMAISATIGMIASIFAGKLADTTKMFKELTQGMAILFFLTALGTRLFLLKTRESMLDDIVLIVLTSLLGALSIPMFPIGSELGVEMTYPVYEATSSGLLVLNGQCLMLIFYGLTEVIKRIDIFYHYESNRLSGNWQLVLDAWLLLAGVTAIISWTVLKPKYRRMEAEKSNKQKFLLEEKEQMGFI